MNEENVQTQELNNDEQKIVEIQQVKSGPVEWFKGLPTWKKITFGGAVVAVGAFGAYKLCKVFTGHAAIETEGKEILNTLEEAQKTVTADVGEVAHDVVEDLAQAQ